LPNDLKGKTAALILADEFEDLELFHPLYRLQEEGISTVVIGLTKEPIKGKKGYSITPSASIDEVSSENFDFLVVPGGKSPEKLRLSKEILRFVRDFDTQGKPIAAICHAGQVLASAGIVKNRTLTCVAGIRDRPGCCDGRKSRDVKNSERSSRIRDSNDRGVPEAATLASPTIKVVLAKGHQ